MQDQAAGSLESTTPRLWLTAADKFGDASAVEDGEIQWSFRDLTALALRATRACMASGVKPGDRVAIWAPNWGEWIVAALGLQAAGAVLVPLSTRFKGSEAGFVLRKSRARLLFSTTDFLGGDYLAMLEGEELPDLERCVILRGPTGAHVAWSDFLAEGDAVSEEDARAQALAVSPDDLSDLIFTSGTTGHPKGVMTCHGQNIRTFATWSDLAGLSEGDRYLIVNPFFHSFGYKAGWLACLMRGATAIPHAVFDVPEVLARVSAEQIHVLPGAPTLYQSILAHPERDRFDLSSLRLAVTGAAAIPTELIHRMRDELGFDTIITAYGLTESCGMVSMCRPGDSAETIATTSGCAISDTEVRCVGEDGVEKPRGEAGEVVVRGYNVMQGYFDEPEETAKAIDSEGWLHTGDIAVMDERGYLRITDRIKDMFIVGGFNCYPAEIENLMFGSGLFAQVAVIGIPDERQGEVGMAFVVPALDAEITPESVVAWCREHMTNYKVPRRVEVLAELPMNASGKVTKFVLRDWAQDPARQAIP